MMALATIGARIPDRVHIVLLTPKSNPEKRGDKSNWLIWGPAYAKPWKPIATVRRETDERVVLPKLPHSRRNIVPKRPAAELFMK